MPHDVVVSRDLHLDADGAWAAWTSAKGLARWWWPQLPDTAYAMDARPGGRYRITSEAAGIGVTGELLVLERPSLIELSWEWLEDGTPLPADRVVVEITAGAAEAASGAARVVVTHTMLDDTDDGSGYQQGWSDVLDRLAALPA